MVGRSKILEISRNAPSAEATPAALEESDTMIAAIKIDDDSHQIEPDEAQSFQPAVTDDWTEELDSSGRPWKAMIVGTILTCMFLGWTGFFAWAYQAELLANPAPARIAELITLWAIPTCLIVLGWLLAMRLSTSEARRFGDVATLLRAESEALEARMRTVNGEIALARSFLAENARELESIGRASSKKLTETAEQLVAALADTDQKAQLLESVSAAAVTNVEMLRNHLPVVTSAAKDTTNQIGNAGNAANEQIRTLTGALKDMLAEMSATSAAMDQLGQQTDETSQKIASAANEASIALGETTERSEKRADQLLSKLHSGVADAEHRIGEAAENIDALGETSSQRLNAGSADCDACCAIEQGAGNLPEQAGSHRQRCDEPSRYFDRASG
jgi:ABC-type multidrug transport system fused ATPase/permease subunit